MSTRGILGMIERNSAVAAQCTNITQNYLNCGQVLQLEEPPSLQLQRPNEFYPLVFAVLFNSVR